MSGLKHIIGADQFIDDPGSMNEIFGYADYYKRGNRWLCSDNPLMGHVVYSVFYEPSTRTRFSFETSVHKLAGSVVSSESAASFSSGVKGESLKHTIRVLDSYGPFAIVLRHKEKGSAAKAVEYLPMNSLTSIINAGDGDGEHPTQALLDIYTIDRDLGGADGKVGAIVGDLLHGRTVHSLVKMLSIYKGLKLYLVAPKIIQIPDGYLSRFIAGRGNSIVRAESLAEIPAGDVDFFYQTRFQEERYEDKEITKRVSSLKPTCRMDAKFIERVKPSAKILHPLPIDGRISQLQEVADEIDDDPRMHYIPQAGNGLVLRMGLFKYLAEGKKHGRFYPKPL
ncbi:aspartate carbamoyltransferase [Candidatus Woesearchaeota archaeon]|nr:aspartate carbamoyltransferase [Candidatus Woesearchaeota archaeon]